MTTFKELMNSMTFKEKVDYLWYYYKIHAIAAVLIIVMITYIITTAVTNRDPAFVIAVLEEVRDPIALTELNETLNEELLTEEERNESEVSIQLINRSTPEGQSQFVTQLAAGTFDMIIAREDTFDLLNNQGSTAILEKYADLEAIDTGQHELLYKDSGQVTGIRTAEMESLQNVIATENSILFVPLNPEHTEYIEPAIKLLTQ